MLSILAICLTAIFLFTASRCDQTVAFSQAKNEICGDGLDNDDNGKSDCADNFCAPQCLLELTVAPTFTTEADSQVITGTHRRAKNITVEISPNPGGSGKATLVDGETWTFTARQLGKVRNELTITADDGLGQQKTVTVYITRVD